MKEKRIDVYLSAVFQLMFLGFGSSFAVDLIKSESSDSILFLSSLFALILMVIIGYLYAQVFSLSRS